MNRPQPDPTRPVSRDSPGSTPSHHPVPALEVSCPSALGPGPHVATPRKATFMLAGLTSPQGLPRLSGLRTVSRAVPPSRRGRGSHPCTPHHPVDASNNRCSGHCRLVLV